MEILFLMIALVWAIGLFYMWRKQTASQPFVSVTILDRMIAVFWPVIYLIIPFAVILHLLNGRGAGSPPPQG